MKVPLGFSSSVPRFGALTAHPDLDTNGVYKPKPPGCDPCLYSPQPMDVAYRKMHVQQSPWRNQRQLEVWARNLGYRNQKILDARRWQRTLLGPAWHEIKEPPKLKAACKNVGFGRVPRFRKRDADIPGPGTYYHAEPYKAPHGPHSYLPTFLHQPVCRFRDNTPNWSLAPNRYELVDKDDVAQLSRRVVSLKGPYNLFTGPRDGSTIFNHYRTSRVLPSSWPLALPGSFEKLKKSHFGEWNKTNKDVPPRSRLGISNLGSIKRNPKEPGPANYRPESMSYEFKENIHGFNSSYDKPRNYVRSSVWPAVGRYNIQSKPCCEIAGHGHKSAFLSKTKRTMGAVLPEKLNTF